MADAVQLVDSEGRFDVRGLDEFVKTVDLASRGLSYTVVSIMGAQSSGKSTLLNHLFGTSFKEMNALLGRIQTTQGVWLAKATNIDPCTLILDLEGTDGRERGEKTVFEKQSSLFALAISDIVLINMWCVEIGREHAANKPLLTTIFQVMMRLFTPRKTTLLFVLRDKTVTSIELLESSVRSEVLKIWDSIPKPGTHRNTQLTEFFNVEVTALSHYFLQKEEFKKDILQLRRRFANSIDLGGLAGDRRGVIPGTGFAVSTEAIWKVVKDNKELDVPTHQVMVAAVRCEEIVEEKLSKFASSKEWLDLVESSKRSAVPGFGMKVTGLVERQIASYDNEAAYFEDRIRRAKRDFLVSSFIEITRPAQRAVLGNHRNNAFKKFKQELETIAADKICTFAESVRQLKANMLAEFEEGCGDASISHPGWEKIQAQFYSSKIVDELLSDLESHSASVQADILFDIASQFEERLKEAIVGPAASLLEAGTSDTWPSLKKLQCQESELAIEEFAATLAGFQLGKGETELVLKLRNVGRNALREKAKAAAGNALRWMRDRFNSVFSQDGDLIIRTWAGDEDVRAITKDARTAALKLLSVLAAIRLEDTADGIESALLTLLGDNQKASTSGSETSADSTVCSSLLAASSWDGVAAEDTLLTPAQCKDIWRQFKTETHDTISQATMVSEILPFGLRLEEAIAGSAASLLEAGSSETWPSLRKLLFHKTELSIKEFASSLTELELDEEEETKLVSKLRVFGRNALRMIANAAAGNALSRMKERFNSVFSQDADSIIRTWTGDEDVRAITKDARTSALKLLSVLAAIRLEDTADGIESALLTLLGDNQKASTSGSETSADSTVCSSLLAASSWDGVAAEDTLLTPAQCKDIWRQFKTETHDTISQATMVSEEAIAGSAASLLEAGSSETWPSLRKLLFHKTELSIKEFASSLTELELDEEEETKLVSKLRVFGRNALRMIANAAAGNALSRMKERFNSVFSQDADSIIRTWTGDEDVRAITKDARTSALKLLSVLAAIRLEDTADGIESALLTLLGDNQAASTSGSETSAESTVRSSLLAASSWDGVAAEDTLLSPAQCTNIWRQFKTETHYAISQAIALQKTSGRYNTSRRGNSIRPPMWAIVVMVALGFNQVMALLRNPVYLAVMFVLYLLGKAVWVQLDITAEFQAGLLRGIISVISKLLPTMFKILKKLADGGQQTAESPDTNRVNVATRANATVAMQDIFSSASSGRPTCYGEEADR